MDNNLYQAVTDAKDKTKTKVKTGIQRYLIWVALLFNVALKVVTKLYQFGFRNPFNIEFLLELVLDTASIMICYACFIVIGQTDEKKRSTTYYKNIDLWANLTEVVRHSYLDIFRKFCVEQIFYERDEAKKLILANYTVISFEEYKQNYEMLNKEQLRALLRENSITTQEYRALLRANGYGLFNPTKVKPINPVIILSGVSRATINDAGRKESSFVARWLTTRPLLIFTTTTVLNTITSTFIGVENNAILGIFISILSIVVASVVGYGAGQQAIRDKEDRIKSRIIFLSLFCQKYSIKTPFISKIPTEKAETPL